MAEPIYLNYGNDAQIDQNEFLNAASNNLESYLAELPWSNKRKNLFRKAYSDIMTRGVVGAENTTGIWNVLHNGNLIDLESLPKKEREMYGEAAYYIQQLMSRIPTKESKEEEKEKEKSELPLFDNKYFTTQFQGYIGNNMFGGRDWDRNSDWNVLDELNSDKLRGTTNRANKLADMLEGYVSTLKEGDHNFEGTPFKNLDDFKSRVSEAVAALRTPDVNDDIDALNRIGLKAEDYLSTGANEPVTYNGELMTRAEALAKIDETERLKLEEEAKKKAEEQQAKEASYIKRIVISNASLYGRTPEQLAEKYKTDTGIIEGINKIITEAGSPDNLTGDLWSDLVGAFKFYNKNGKLEDLSVEELLKFSRLKNFENLLTGSLKRLPGVEGIYFDTRSLRLVIPTEGDSLTTAAGDLLSSYSKDAKLKEYMDRKVSGIADFSKKEWAEITGVIADIASIIDPEPFSAAALGLGAAGLRHYARNQEPDSWGFWDVVGQIGDYATGLVGAIPIAGDAILAAKAVRAIKRIAKFPVMVDILSNAGPVKDIITNKILGSESMTAQDWKDLSEFFRGLVGGAHIRKANLAERKVLEHRGVKVTPDNISGTRQKIGEWGRKHGFLRTNPKESVSTTNTVKVNIDGKTLEIKLSDKSAKELKESLEKAGNSKTKRNEEVAKIEEVLKAQEKAATDAGKEIKDVKVEIQGGWRLRNVPGVRHVFGSSKKSPVVTTKDGKTLAQDKSKDDFEDWIKTQGWRQREYRAIDNNFQRWGFYDGSPRPKLTDRPIKDPLTMSVYRDARTYRNAIDNAINPKGSGAVKTIKNGLTGEITVNGKRIQFKYTRDNSSGDYKLVIDNNGSVKTHNFKKEDGVFEAKKLVALEIEKVRMEGRKAARANKLKNDLKMSELIKSIRDLKRKGFLLKGGTLDNRDAYTIVSEFLNKLK